MSGFLKNKDAELTTQQIVGLIVLIVSFSIILILIFRLDLGKETNKEICHNSVVLKSKSNFIGGDLDCRTSYVCISGGGECEGINPTSTVDIDLKKDAKEQIEKAIAEEMADCWWMFGEGKVDYIGGVSLVGKIACALCSKIAFDEEIRADKELSKGISYEYFYNFMNNKKKDKTHTYLQYLGIDKNKLGQDYLKNEIKFDKQYSIFTGMTKESLFSEIFGGVVLPEFEVTLEDKTEEERSYIQVSILEEVKDAKCTEFITKA